MRRKKLRIILVSMLAFIGLTACTPYEQAIWNSLSPDQQTAVVQEYKKNTAPSVCFEGKKNTENCKIGWAVASAEGYTVADFLCLDYIVMHESAWYNVPNAAGGRAYGIPQALPGSKMATHGSDWATNPWTQVDWLVDYVDDRYDTPCKAMNFKKRVGWY